MAFTDFDISGMDFGSLFPNQRKQTPAKADRTFTDDRDLIKGELRSTIESGGMSEFLNQMLLTGTKKIGRQAGSAREAIRESSASSGFAGANVNVFTDLFEAEAEQVGELQTGVGSIAEQSKLQALGQMIGVNQFDITNEEQKRQFEKMFGLKERELDAMIDAQGGDFMSVLGKFLGAGAGVVAGGAFAGLGAGLGDIFEGFFDPTEEV